MMLVLSVITSIFSVVFRNCITNMLSKTKLKNIRDINTFNIISYGMCVVIFGIMLLRESLSLFTVLVSLIFGVVTALNATYSMLALSTGPMHITLLIGTSSMIIPTMSGIFFGEKFSPLKFIAVLVLIGFLYMSLDKKSTAKTSKKWFWYCGLYFVLQGAIGVIQKIHQSSHHKAETSGFLFVAFICSVLFATIRNKGNINLKALGKSNVIFGIICGVCVFLMNYINLRLSGILPSQLFFPLINGSCIVLSSLASVIIFKEALSKKQLIGLIGGIASLIAICLVP